jgi:flagellar protein FliS
MFLAQNPASTYRRVGLESDVQCASPHRLVQLLYDAAIQSVRSARQHLSQGHLAEKGMAVTKAIRIVDEGLKASLDHARGGQIAAKLAALYDYLCMRLVVANRTNDAKGLQEVEGLLVTLGESWAAIDPFDAGRRTVAPNAAPGCLAAA